MYLEVIIAMNFTYLLSPRGRLHFLLIRIIHNPEIVLQHNTFDKRYPSANFLCLCKQVGQH